jgi:spore maturation protein A
MLNYIWGGLIILSLVFAVGNDVQDYINQTYENGRVRNAQLLVVPSETETAFKSAIALNKDTVWASVHPKTQELRFSETSQLPEIFQAVWKQVRAKESEPLRATIKTWDKQTGELTFVLPAVHFVKLKAITKAAFDTATTAVELAIGLIGVMAFWLGLMQIAEKSGMIESLVKVVQPVLHFLFPDIPKNHPALGSISLNLTANMLGLGNAATPLGIKAMEELQTLNAEKDTATDSMIMFLTMNTASVQLVPPVTLIALMGMGVGEILPAIILTTMVSLTIGIVAAKWFAKKQRKGLRS